MYFLKISIDAFQGLRHGEAASRQDRNDGDDGTDGVRDKFETRERDGARA